MERTLVNITIDPENLPADFPEMAKQDKEIVGKWKEDGTLQHVFLKEAQNGVVFIFSDVDKEKVEILIKTLPIYKIQKSVEYLSVKELF